MPSSSKKQHNFMEAIAHNPGFAKKVGIPQSVGKDFSNADKGKSFSKGGDMATKMDPKMLAMMMAKKKGMRAPMPSSDMGMRPPAAPMMNKGGMTKMAGGGMPMKDGKPTFVGDGKGMMNKGGAIKKNMGGMAYAKGGGIESRGKTKGTMIRMKSGGAAC